MDSEHTALAAAGWLRAKECEENAFAYEPLRFQLARVLPAVEAVCVSEIGGQRTIVAVAKSTLFVVEVEIQIDGGEKTIALRIERHHLSPEKVVVALSERVPVHVAVPRREREWSFRLPSLATGLEIKTAEMLKPAVSEGPPADELVARAIAAACGWQMPSQSPAEV